MNLEVLFVLLFGLSFGSFANVLILRVPKDLSLLTSSQCPKCQTKIKVWHNIPVISWIFLRGKCSNCGEKISFQYPFVELLTAGIYLILYFKLGFSWQFLILSLTFMLILVLAVIDFYYKAVPDSINLLILTFAIAYPLSPGILENLTNALLFAGGFSLMRFYVSYFAKKEAMGEGDIMIAGTIGAILGGYFGLVAIFLSAIISLPFSLIARIKGNPEVPFIPFLGIALFIVYIFQEETIKIINHLIF